MKRQRRRDAHRNRDPDADHGRRNPDGDADEYTHSVTAVAGVAWPILSQSEHDRGRIGP